MNKNDPPASFGVFKPVGHILIAFRGANQLQSAIDQLLTRGFATSDLTRYSPQEMIDQVNRELSAASPLASPGNELDFIRAHKTLAEAGSQFLVVQAEGAVQVERVAQVARATGAARAQRYGRLVIEEIIAQPVGSEAGTQ